MLRFWQDTGLFIRDRGSADKIDLILAKHHHSGMRRRLSSGQWPFRLVQREVIFDDFDVSTLLPAPTSTVLAFRSILMSLDWR